MANDFRGDDGVKYREIEGSRGYFVGSDGSVWSYFNGKARKRKLSVLPNRRKYVYFRRRLFQVSRLVLTAFRGPAPAGTECCHNDGDCQNNAIDNLRWGTRQSNLEDLHKHGGLIANQGPANCNAKLTPPEVVEIVAEVQRGKSYTEVGRAFGVTSNTVKKIAVGMHWTHVTGIQKRPTHPNGRRRKSQ